jgi:alpha-L-fucosidase
VEEKMLPQMKDLVNRYEPELLWADGEWDHPSETWRSAEFLSWLYNESPVKETVAVNDRWGKETRGKHGGYYTTEYDLVHDDNVAGSSIQHPWEECRGMGGSFGYNRNEKLEDYESSESLVHILVDKVARGGNLLLNIGATADGRIPVIMQQRLADIGSWLAVNGEGIYGTRAWEKAPAINKETTTFYTTKNGDLYVILTKWPEAPFTVEGIGKAESVSLLGYSGKVKFSKSGQKLTIVPPSVSPANMPCQYAWVFKIEKAL